MCFLQQAATLAHPLSYVLFWDLMFYTVLTEPLFCFSYIKVQRMRCQALAVFLLWLQLLCWQMTRLIKVANQGTEIMTRSCVGCARIPDGNEQQLKSAPRIVNCYVANETKLKLQTINHICTHRY